MFSEIVDDVQWEKRVIDLNPLPESVDGNHSFIYRCPNNIYFKRICDEDAIPIIDKDAYETFREFSKMNLRSFVVPEENLIMDGRIIGYFVRKVFGDRLDNLSNNVTIDSLFRALDFLFDDVIKLSERRILVKDLNLAGIFFNDIFENIDMDAFRISERSYDEIINANIKRYNSILFTGIIELSAFPFYSIYIYNNFRSVQEKEKIINTSDRKAIREFLIFFQEFLFKKTKIEINTIGDMSDAMLLLKK